VYELDALFPRYTQHGPRVPIWCITPETDGCIHRFFDTSPVSPSGRYVALFRLPFESRLPAPGDRGEVVLVDLRTGEHRILADTAGWEPQMGANVQWGATDDVLLYNDVDTDAWEPFAWKLNPHTGERVRLPGGLYRVSPDGRRYLACTLTAMRRTQRGYGVVVPEDATPRNVGLRDDDGLFITDTETGERRLLISIREIIEQTDVDPGYYDGREVYGFHSKWSPDGSRLLFTLRHFPADHPNRYDVIRDGGDLLRFDVYTMDIDGGDLHNAVPADQWDKGGHHINFFPDGTRLSMNLAIDRGPLKFVQVDLDGSDLRKILDSPDGSGHPTVHVDAVHILTDEYARARMAYEDGTTPLRWIDIRTGHEIELARIPNKTPYEVEVSTLRVDPHPAWAPDNRHVVFNTYLDGTRRVMLADLGQLVGR